MQIFFTLKELDQALLQPKGTAFRLFKSMLPALTETRDFQVLSADEDSETINGLKLEKRVYPQSRNVVLLSEATFKTLEAAYKKQSL